MHPRRIEAVTAGISEATFSAGLLMARCPLSRPRKWRASLPSRRPEKRSLQWTLKARISEFFHYQRISPTGVGTTLTTQLSSAAEGFNNRTFGPPPGARQVAFSVG